MIDGETSAQLKRAIGTMHRWLGLATGLVVFVVGLTGAVYAFEAELREALYPERYFVPVPADTSRASLDRMRAAADAAAGPDAPLTEVRVFRDPERSVVFAYLQDDPEALGYSAGKVIDLKVYVDPYTAEVREVVDHKWEPFEVVYWTHISLLLGYRLGHTITSWSVVIFFGMMISGLFLWWPRQPSAVPKRLWFRWQAGTGWKRKNYDLHSILGFYAMWIAAFMALTGLVWSFDVVKDTLQWIANRGPAPAGTWYKSAPADPATEAPLDVVLSGVAGRHPDARFYKLYVKNLAEPEGVIYATAMLGEHGIWKNSWYAFDQYSMERLGGMRHDDKPAGELLYDSNYDLHTGRILGLPGKILVFCTSLTVASLPVSGALLWWGRRKKKPRPAG